WGKGFVMALSKKWPEPEHNYRRWHRAISMRNTETGSSPTLTLGLVQFVLVEDKDVTVANLVGQRGVRTKHNPSPVSYEAIEAGFKRIRDAFWNMTPKYSIHMPRIGCGLAGGEWNRIEPLIEKHLHEFEVYVYDLPS